MTRSSTKEQRRKFDIGDLFINAIVCPECKDYVRSRNRYDFKRCKCGKCFVVGGSWYSQYGGNPISIIEMFYDVEEEHKNKKSQAKILDTKN